MSKKRGVDDRSVQVVISTVLMLKSAKVGAPSNVSYLTMKERPCHVYSDSMPSKQIIGQTVTYNGTTTDFEVKS